MQIDAHIGTFGESGWLTHYTWSASNRTNGLSLLARQVYKEKGFNDAMPAHNHPS